MGSSLSPGKQPTVLMRLLLLLVLCSLVAGDNKRLDCNPEDRQCPGGAKPRDPCNDGSRPECPNGGDDCPYYKRKCSDGFKALKQCTHGKPHCPFRTKDRYPGRCCIPGEWECPGIWMCVPSPLRCSKFTGYECGFA